MFRPGDKVRTNRAYFDLFGRLVYGTVTTVDDSGHVAVVVWDRQVGNKIPVYQGKHVIMMANTLVPDV